MRSLPIVLTLLVLAGSAGCAARDGEAGTPSAPSAPGSAGPAGSAGPGGDAVNLVRDGYAGRFRIAALVLQNERHGPQLCTAADMSLPPQCGGPDIAGWTWDGVRHDGTGATKWGSYLVTGTFDGRTLTLTEPAKVNDGSLGPKPHIPDFSSPCPEPAGGWKPVAPAKATDDALRDATGLVSGDADFGGLWLDQREPAELGGTPFTDPAKVVLNVRFTKDLARHEADIRKVWGGALCVTQAKHSEADLSRLRDELTAEPGMTDASVDVVTGTVRIGVFMATQGRQRELDAKYGPGLVSLAGALEPID